MINLNSANELERECIEHIYDRLGMSIDCMGKDVEQFKKYIGFFDECVIYQPPYTDNHNNVRYSDLSIISKKLGFNIRFEVASLEKKSNLQYRVHDLIVQSKNMPEDVFCLVLVGKGFDNVVKEITPQLENLEKPTVILRSINEYKEYVDALLE